MEMENHQFVEEEGHPSLETMKTHEHAWFILVRTHEKAWVFQPTCQGPKGPNGLIGAERTCPRTEASEDEKAVTRNDSGPEDRHTGERVCLGLLQRLRLLGSGMVVMTFKVRMQASCPPQMLPFHVVMCRGRRYSICHPLHVFEVWIGFCIMWDLHQCLLL